MLGVVPRIGGGDTCPTYEQGRPHRLSTSEELLACLLLKMCILLATGIAICPGVRAGWFPVAVIYRGCIKKGISCSALHLFFLKVIGELFEADWRHAVIKGAPFGLLKI